MITLRINEVPTLFIKAFAASDVHAIIEFVREAANLYTGSSNRVLFIDTPITAATVETVDKLKSEGFQVVFRDHHGIDGEPSNDRETQVAAATAKLKHILGDDCLITVRRLHPACSTLVSAGEFRDAVAIIADPDADGLTAAMKAAGICYPGLDDDASLLDGDPQLQITGTPISQLLAKGMVALPSYDPATPRERENAHQQLFTDWLKAVSGNEAALKRLKQGEAVYDGAVKVSHALAANAVAVAPSVLLVDATDQPVYDPGTLNALLESDNRCRIMVVKKSLGPIAALHGTQYSLSLARAYQSTMNLQALVPSNARSDPEAGVIANVSFLLHISEDVWQSEVLPRLKLLDCMES